MEKIATLAVNSFQKCIRDRFNTVPQYHRRLDLLPEMPTTAPEISEIEPMASVCVREILSSDVVRASCYGEMITIDYTSLQFHYSSDLLLNQ